MCSEAQHQKSARRRKKVAAKNAKLSSDSDSGGEENLTDEEVEFDGLDFRADDVDNQAAAAGSSVGFNEEDVQFSDSDGKQILIRIVMGIALPSQ